MRLVSPCYSRCSGLVDLVWSGIQCLSEDASAGLGHGATARRNPACELPEPSPLGFRPADRYAFADTLAHRVIGMVVRDRTPALMKRSPQHS